MNPLTNKQKNSNEKAKICVICGKQFQDKYANDKKYCKVRDQCNSVGEYKGAPHIINNLRYSIPKEILVIFYNGSNYDYHFILKEEGGIGNMERNYKNHFLEIEIY